MDRRGQRDPNIIAAKIAKDLQAALARQSIEIPGLTVKRSADTTTGVIAPVIQPIVRNSTG